MAKWEYSVITINTEYEVPFDGKIEDSPESRVIIEKHLTRMGAAGWELATFLPAMPMPQKWKGNEFANPWMYHAVFKRRVED
jgi:hypothetical protein